jgi:sugar phosphate isomerase/epimerase
VTPEYRQNRVFDEMSFMPREITIAATTGLLRRNAPLRLAPPEPAEWTSLLGLLANLGVDSVDFGQFWGPLHDFDDHQIAVLRQVLTDLGLGVSGISLVGFPFDYPPNDSRNYGDSYARVRRGIEQAALLDARVVSLGLHPMADAPAPSDALGYPPMTNADIDRFASPLRELANFAETLGVALSFEMHESSILFCANHVLQLLDAIGAPNVGANPDLGNLIRHTGPLAETWDETIRALKDKINYWHIKNATRMEIGRDTYRTTPTGIPAGSVDYRAMLEIALRAGFTGPLVVEHSAGDRLWHAREGVTYLRSVLADLGVRRSDRA